MDIVITLKVPPNFIKNIERFVLSELSTRLNKALIDISSKLREVLRFYLDLKIYDSPEYRALNGGTLQGELGVVEYAKATSDILEAIVEAAEIIVIPVTVVSGKLNGGLQCSVLKTKMEEVLGIPLGKFLSTNFQGNTTIVPWLEWLLTRGNQIIVIDYSFKTSSSISSRTGLGLMVKGSGWRVPPEFAGTYQDNWLTRAFNGVEIEVGNFIIGELKFRLK